MTIIWITTIIQEKNPFPWHPPDMWSEQVTWLVAIIVWNSPLPHTSPWVPGFRVWGKFVFRTLELTDTPTNLANQVEVGHALDQSEFPVPARVQVSSWELRYFRPISKFSCSTVPVNIFSIWVKWCGNWTYSCWCDRREINDPPSQRNSITKDAPEFQNGGRQAAIVKRDFKSRKYPT